MNKYITLLLLSLISAAHEMVAFQSATRHVFSHTSDSGQKPVATQADLCCYLRTCRLHSIIPSKPSRNSGGLVGFWPIMPMAMKSGFIAGLLPKASSISCPTSYPISDVKTDLYLAEARALFKKYTQLSAQPSTAGFADKQLLKNEMNALQIKAAKECARWIVPPWKAVEEGFAKERTLKDAFLWNITGRRTLSIGIDEHTGLFWRLSDPTINKNRVVTKGAVKDVWMGLAPLWTIGGYILIDKDVLRGVMTHEASHFIKYDGIRNQLNRITKVPDKANRICQQEINADLHACTYSKSACIGKIKDGANQMRLEQTTGAVFDRIWYPSPSKRLATAIEYAQKSWNISPEECQKYVNEGIQLADESLEMLGNL